MDYESLRDTLVNVQNSETAAKKNALRNVSQALVDGEEPDFPLRLRATGILAALNVPLDVPDEEISGWVSGEVVGMKNEIESRIEDASEMEVDGGRRKRRRGTKAKSKAKKSRRYTRRR